MQVNSTLSSRVRAHARGRSMLQAAACCVRTAVYDIVLFKIKYAVACFKAAAYCFATAVLLDIQLYGCVRGLYPEQWQ